MRPVPLQAIGDHLGHDLAATTAPQGSDAVAGSRRCPI